MEQAQLQLLMILQLHLSLLTKEIMLKNLTQHTEIIDGKEFHFVADYDSNFNQVKTALIKTMTYFDGLEEQQKKWETQERLLFYVNKHEKDITAIKQRLCM